MDDARTYYEIMYHSSASRPWLKSEPGQDLYKEACIALQRICSRLAAKPSNSAEQALHYYEMAKKYALDGERACNHSRLRLVPTLEQVTTSTALQWRIWIWLAASSAPATSMRPSRYYTCNIAIVY